MRIGGSNVKARATPTALSHMASARGNKKLPRLATIKSRRIQPLTNRRSGLGEKAIEAVAVVGIHRIQFDGMLRIAADVPATSSSIGGLGETSARPSMHKGRGLEPPPPILEGGCTVDGPTRSLLKSSMAE